MATFERHQTRRRGHPLLAPGAVVAAAAAFAAFVGAVDPNEPGHYPTCPWLSLTDTYCPGCGSLRMIHALVHGDVAEAFGRNPFAFAMLPVLGYMWAAWSYRRLRGRSRARVLHPGLIWLFLVVVIAFWVVRNLPFGQALAP
jgi:hypothetical protein